MSRGPSKLKNVCRRSCSICGSATTNKLVTVEKLKIKNYKTPYSNWKKGIPTNKAMYEREHWYRTKNKDEYMCKHCYEKTVRSSSLFKTEIIKVLCKGLDKPRCVRCGFEDIRALQLDHIMGGGAQELRKFKRRANMLKYYLSLPEGEMQQYLQVLCANCNWIKRYETISEYGGPKNIVKMPIFNPHHMNLKYGRIQSK